MSETSPTRILIAEDERRIASFIEEGLSAQGFEATVVADGASALAAARDEDFDLLLLDLGLPGLDGHAVLRGVRARGERLPVIVLTARDSLVDTVTSLNSGADDYITKPFRFEELVARIRVRLREAGAAATELQCGQVVLDLRSRRARLGGTVVELSTQEFLLAQAFCEHRGQVLTREQLLSRVWGYQYDPGSNIADVYVRYLRKKLGASFIETVRGSGYRAG